MAKKSNYDAEVCESMMTSTLYDRRHAILVLKQDPDDVIKDYPLLLRPLEVCNGQSSF